ncbi:MAG: DUF2752 domain-containing protein [Chloroflexota bacterium]|nr:DUF2752 domain-containing protein [Chloroflexota bacterium]
MPRAARSAIEGIVPAIVWEAVSGSSPRGRLWGALALGATLALIGPDRLAHGPPICLISTCIRRPCPACGMTRAASALLRGDLRRAIRTNPRIVLAAIISGAILFSDLISVVKQGERDARSTSPRQPGQWKSVPA